MEKKTRNDYTIYGLGPRMWQPQAPLVLDHSTRNPHALRDMFDSRG